MVIVIAPDSFKGSLSALQAAQAMERGIRRVWPEANIHLLPMADGGEGTLDAVLAATGGRRLEAPVTGGHGRPLAAAYGVLEDGTAVIEVAQVVGITLPGMREVAVAARTTEGLGDLLRHCLERGIRRFMVGLGGSATNDGGIGMLAALGACFRDKAGALVRPVLEGMPRVVSADFTRLDARLRECEIVLLSDVDNPLCGERGATAVYGPQKGVAPGEIAAYDSLLQSFAALCDRQFGRMYAHEAGAGAAGGLGYAFRLIGGRHQSGAGKVAELIGLDAALQRADWVMTGEGRSDFQTLQGKAPVVVARHARQFHVPVTLVSGGIEEDARSVLSAHFDGCFSLLDNAPSLAEAIRNADFLLADCAEMAARSHHPV